MNTLWIAVKEKLKLKIRTIDRHKESSECSPVVAFAKNKSMEGTIKFNVDFHQVLLTFDVDCLWG